MQCKPAQRATRCTMWGRRSAQEVLAPRYLCQKGASYAGKGKALMQVPNSSIPALIEGTTHTEKHRTHLCIMAELFELHEGSVQGLMGFSQL